MERAVPIGLALCVLAIVILGLRVLQLEDTLERAEARLGRASDGSDTAGAELAPARPAGLEPRLSLVEKDLRALRDDLRTLEKATEATLAVPAPATPANTDPRQILSVVKGEADRVRDRQLEFARKAWTTGRKTALDRFGVDHRLAPEQKEQLEELLNAETDRLIALMRRPDALENPEQIAADFAVVLRDTDRAAHGVLEPGQVPAWDLARTIERRVLWPWLPED